MFFKGVKHMREEKRNNKILHILKAVASGLVWGLGQLFNKQYIKALMFFFSIFFVYRY